MKTFDRIVAWTMLAFALLHIAASVVFMSNNLTIAASRHNLKANLSCLSWKWRIAFVG